MADVLAEHENEEFSFVPSKTKMRFQDEDDYDSDKENV